jgi:hypothetical protein
MTNFNMSVQVYYDTQEVVRTDRVFAFMFTNLGDVTANVNGMVIYPNSSSGALGDSRTVSGQDGQEYKGKIILSFDSASGGAAPAVEIVQLYYVD